MQLRDIAMLSTRAFKTNPARTWLTIAGMGVGTGAVVTLVGLGFGLQNIILEQIVFGETLLSLTVNNPPSKIVQINTQTVKDFAPLARCGGWSWLSLLGRGAGGSRRRPPIGRCRFY